MSNRYHVAQLPFAFKIAGRIMTVAILVLSIATRLMNVRLGYADVITHQQLMAKLMILALAIIAASREKTEDELMESLRLKAISYAFISAIIFTFFLPFTNLVNKEPIEVLNSDGLVLIMLVVFNLAFYFHKRAANG